MFYNYWVGFISETYLFLAVCVSLNLTYLNWTSYGKVFNSLMSISISAILIAFPVFVVTFYNLRNNFSRILSADEEFFDRFGNVIKDLNFKRQGRLVLLHVFFIFLRKFWLAHIVVY